MTPAPTIGHNVRPVQRRDPNNRHVRQGTERSVEVTWFKQCPERLEWELRALADAGFDTSIDEAAREAGQITLTVRCPVNGALHDLRVDFPDAYPYFPFQVSAPTLSLARHQDPYAKTLCFVRHIENEWHTEDTVAMYLLDRLPSILRANESVGPFAGEAQEGAPVTEYFPTHDESVVRYGDWVVSPAKTKGTLELGVEDGTNPHELLRAIVLAVKDEAGDVLGEFDARVQRVFPRRFRGRWVRLPARPNTNDLSKIVDEVAARWPQLRVPMPNGDAPDVIGVVFADEARYRELHDVWLFLVRRQDRKVNGARNRRKPDGDKYTLYFAQPDRIGPSDMQARLPRLIPLADKKAVIFGLGALGSMACWQLARAGIGRLAVWDHDRVTGGTSPRWLLGMFAAGRFKARMLQNYLQYGYPHVAIEAFIHRLGAAGINPAIAQADLNKALDGADIVIDCTAEFTIHHYLSAMARERGVPYVWASGTMGGWGGVVGRAMPHSGCWECYSRYRTDGTIVAPTAEDVADIQPIGCFSPTFTGTGFDLDLVSTMAARLAIATLCRCASDSYGDFAWDVGIVDLWHEGRPIAPKWTTYTLARHAGCDKHA